MKMIKLF